MREIYGFKFVEHTDGLAVLATGEVLPDVYRYQAQALFESLVGLKNIDAKSGVRIEVSGKDLEDLLVQMLTDLLFHFHKKKQVYSEFVVEYLTHEKLIVYAKGEPFDPARHSIKTNIKAATDHDLTIAPSDEGFFVTVEFDV